MIMISYYIFIYLRYHCLAEEDGIKQAETDTEKKNSWLITISLVHKIT